MDEPGQSGVDRDAGGTLRLTRRDVLLALGGWAVGLMLVWQFGPGTEARDGFGRFLLAMAAAVAVPLIGPWIIERRLPRRRTGRWDANATVSWGISSLIFCVTMPAAIRVSDPLRFLSLREVWLLFAAAYPISAVLYLSLDRVRSFRERVGIRSPTWVGPTAVGILVSVGIVSWFAANRIVGTGTVVPYVCEGVPRWVCDSVRPELPVLPAQAFVGFAAVALAALGTRFLDWRRVPALLIAGNYIILVLWSERVWRMVSWGELDLGSTGSQLLTLQVTTGVLFAAAIIASSMFPRSPLFPESWRLAPVSPAPEPGKAD